MRAIEVLPAGAWNAADAADAVLLDFDGRHRRRVLLTTQAGHEVLLDLPQAVRLREGDGLRLVDGGLVRVQARAERLLEIHAHGEDTLVRIVWHLGNRHLPVQVLPGHIRIRYDHVVAGMIEGLGGHAEEITAPFDPEPGAYAAGGHHRHHGDDGHHHG